MQCYDFDVLVENNTLEWHEDINGSVVTVRLSTETVSNMQGIGRYTSMLWSGIRKISIPLHTTVLQYKSGV